jgi:predicted nucleic acid-binding protein
MILVDTSVWVGHLRAGDAEIVRLLEQNLVAMHPCIIGELACGNLDDRDQLLGYFQKLPSAPKATDEEVLYFIDEAKLMGNGIGWVDAHLLASVKLDPSQKLWTRDKRLKSIATELGLAWERAGARRRG